MGLTSEDVLRIVRDKHIRFIRLQFIDIYGIPKNVAIPAEELEAALNGEHMFDGSSIDGFARIEESDMYLRPDPTSFVILPWGDDQHLEARIICDVYTSDGKPFPGCPRGNLKRVLNEAREMGIDDMYVGPEAEFFLFQTDQDGRPTTFSHDEASYFDLAPVDGGENARRDIVLTLEQMGFQVEASHHELAPGQHEIDFKYDTAIHTADKVVTFKTVVRRIANKHGLHATFMPKPVFGIAGSGMHLNISLSTKGANLFYDPSAPQQLSQTALYFIGGILKHARAITAITNPLVNSYKRLVSGFEAPVYIAWSFSNRSPLIRIPAKRGAYTRIEFRSPDPSANPYLAFAVTLKAGLDGIRNKTLPPAPCERNVYEMTAEERKARGIGDLPANLGEALQELERDSVIREALGEHIFERYVEGKLQEWNTYRMQVHPWEIEQYLFKY